jgi:hypothetical protein
MYTDDATSWCQLAGHLIPEQIPRFHPEAIFAAPTRQFDTAFDAIVAAFDESPRCEMVTLSGGKCPRAARWRIDLHGCELVIACGQHKKAWIQEALANLWHGLRPRCVHCGKEFNSFDDAVRITAL